MSEPVGVQAGRVCPACGQEDSIPLIWGMPASEDLRLAERGLVSLVAPEWFVGGARTCQQCASAFADLDA
jgi:hypothetical protein